MKGNTTAESPPRYTKVVEISKFYYLIVTILVHACTHVIIVNTRNNIKSFYRISKLVGPYKDVSVAPTGPIDLST